MSLEAFGDGGDILDPEDLLRNGWACDATGDRWWKAFDPDVTMSFAEAAEAYEESRASDADDDYDPEGYYWAEDLI